MPPSPCPPPELLQDETGAHSMARTLVLRTTVCAVVYAFLDLVPLFDAPNAGYSMFGGMIVVFGSWAAGPRIAQYLAPQLGALAAAIGQAKRDPRLPSRADREGDPT